MKKITALCTFLLLTFTSYSQISPIGGKWWGILDVGGRKLTIASVYSHPIFPSLY